MSRKRFDEMNCSIARSLEQVGDWWTLLIVREAFFGTTAFSEFQEALGIAKNILTQRLDHLVANGIFERRQVRPGVERHEYFLTDKGRDLMPVLVALVQWGDRWLFGEGNEPLRVIDAEQRVQIAPLKVCDAAGREVAPSQLRFRPGPGATERTLRVFEERRSKRRAASIQ
ncbi:MAG: helix-turn-helix transcriptional regulator [Sphingomonadaceae bacterium]|nr:helix-turn-helix transcriptional regulator [Sphingomonadaceae bacterium]